MERLHLEYLEGFNVYFLKSVKYIILSISRLFQFRLTPTAVAHSWAPALQLIMTITCFSTAAAVKSLHSCPTLCDPIDGSPPGSPVPGILQARTLEWVAISFSDAWKEKWKWSRSVVSDSVRPHGLQPTRLLHPWIFQARVLEWGASAFSNVHP